MEIVSKFLPGTLSDPLYPDSDAENVGESDLHVEALIFLREALRDFFSEAPEVYVASDMFWYWEKGNPKACTAPDGLVAKGVVGKHGRKSFREWEEKVRPCVIFEIASERTWKEDAKDKRDLYASLRVPEYFLFDPETVYLQPALQGYRLVNEHYEAIEPDNKGYLNSEELGLRMCLEGSMLRFRDVRTGRRVLTRQEQAEQARREAKREARKRKQEVKEREQERLRANALQAELDQLRSALKPPDTDKQEG